MWYRSWGQVRISRYRLDSVGSVDRGPWEAVSSNEGHRTQLEVTQMPLSWQLHAFGATLAICTLLGRAGTRCGSTAGVLRVVRERERRDELESRDEAGGP